MGTTMAFLQSPGIELLFIVMSSNLARYGIMASPPNFKIFPGIPSGPTDFFPPVAANRFLIMLVLTVKGLAESVDWIIGFFRSQLNTDV
jgi:hypothetical protein